MKNIVISVGFFVIFSIMAADALTQPQLLGCKQFGTVAEKYYDCKTVTPGCFEIGDNRTWENLTDAKKFRFESRSPGIPSAFIFKSANMLKYFPNLKQLTIAAENITFPYDIVIDEEKWSNMKENLFNKPGLEALWLEGGGMNFQRHFWKLPSSLTSLTLIRQNYASYDLENLADLQNLTIWKSSLYKMPVLSRIPPPLVHLNLSNNPLFDFSVNDIAPLCHLEYLSFDYSTMGSRFRNCECKRLKKWIEYLNNSLERFVFEGKFVCGNPNLSEDECREYNLDRAYAKRDKCLHKFEPGSGGSDEADDYLEHILLTDSKRISQNSPTTFLIMAVCVMIVLISLSSGGAYIYINYIRTDPNLNTSIQSAANANQQQQPQPQAQPQPPQQTSGN